MSPPPPIISVIVVCKNPGPHLQSALASVWSQREIKSELIVIDGASIDGTREWLESQRSRIATLVCEPDRGVYDAMNKAVAAARGDWLYFLGADDQLANHTVLSAVARELRHASGEVIAGEANYNDGRTYRFSTPANPLARNFLHHQSAFYRRSLFGEHGGFDASLAIMADYDFNLRLWKKKVRFDSLSVEVARCAAGGRSDAGRWRGYSEEITVRHRHFSMLRCWPWDVVTIMRFLRKKILRSFPRHG